MNIYATGKEGSAKNSNDFLCLSTNNTEAIKTPITVTIANNYSWTVVVPASFDLNDKNTTSGKPSPFSQTDTISIKSDSVLGSKTLTVTPKLNRETDYDNPDNYPIDMAVTANNQGSPATVSGDVISFTQTTLGAANLTVSIKGEDVTTWKTNKPDGLTGVMVANITYSIAGDIFES